MTRLFLITLLLLSSTPTYAEWELLLNDTGVGGTIYVDPDTIRRKGDVVKWWELADYMTVQTGVAGSSYFSSKGQHEYDCAEERTRMIAFTWFSDHMGRGAVVVDGSHYEGKWSPVAPHSIGQALWKAACSKK
jgi:hypothetical protein